MPLVPAPEFPDRRLIVKAQRDEAARKAEEARLAAIEAARVAEEARLAQVAALAAKVAQEAPTQPIGVWDSLANCESGGDWAISTGNGFWGGLQFDFGTWGQYAGYYTANLAPRAVQIERAEQIRSDRGFYPWPACATRLGLI